MAAAEHGEVAGYSRLGEYAYFASKPTIALQDNNQTPINNRRSLTWDPTNTGSLGIKAS